MITKTGKNIDKAIEILNRDGIVAIPTETVYGLACNALSEKAVNKLYIIKGRDYRNPLTIQLDSFEKASLYVNQVPDIFYKIARKYSPGALTYVFEKNDIIPGFTTGYLNTIGIRVPAHPMALEILNRINFPLAVTSGNPSGFSEPLTAFEVLKNFKAKIPYILDGGSCIIGKASTVISYVDNQLVILREGAISGKELEEFMGIEQ